MIYSERIYQDLLLELEKSLKQAVGLAMQLNVAPERMEAFARRYREMIRSPLQAAIDASSAQPDAFPKAVEAA